jgi:hypothetical protein
LDLPLARWLSGGPSLVGELLVPLQGEPPAARVAADLAAKARGPAIRAGARMGGFWAWPQTAGLEAELYLRQRVAGPLHLFGRTLLHACGLGAEKPGYNDFYRGILPARPLASFAVFNTELILAPASLAVPAWETVIFRELELSAFGDLLWEEAASLSGELAPSLGISLRAEAALWGLLPLRAMLSAGYDLRAGEVFVSLNLGYPF